MPYVISVIIDFDTPGLELERTQDLLLEQEELPTRADIDRQMPGVIQHLLDYPRYEFQAPAYANATYTWEIEAIFHVEPFRE